VLSVNEGRFQIVDSGGRFILKPNPPPYAEVPQNEAFASDPLVVLGAAKLGMTRLIDNIEI
jgi:hypothetical protein